MADLRPAAPDAVACARAWQGLRVAHDRVARRLAAELAEGCGLAVTEYDALLYLRAEPGGPHRLGALLAVVPLSQPALSRLVARLETRGLLERARDPADARASLLRLTDAGAALADRAAAIHARAVHDTLTSKFTHAEQAALLRTLRRIAR